VRKSSVIVSPPSPDTVDTLPPLADAERAELQRQGAKSAARGEAADANPLRRQPNAPAHTGESQGSWLERHDAWQQGHDAQSDRNEGAQRDAADTHPRE
jgi:hypothetical protein